MRIYHDEIDAPMRYILESYDKGYLLSGKGAANYSLYNWIIKTDINGEILWEKTIGDGLTSIVLPQMAMNNSGDLYICGETRNNDPSGDPIIIKLNACGEKEWCKVLYSSDHHDFADCICITPDGGCAVTLNFTGPGFWDNRICLAKFSVNGMMEWKQCYNSQDSLLGNEDDAHLLLTPDNGFLITGWCYYTDPSGTLSWLHPYYIKTDSIGTFEWDLIAERETGESGGQAWQTISSSDSQFFYSSISHYYHDPMSSAPALLKIDFQGNLIDIYDLAIPDEIGKLFDAKFINNALLAASASWGVDSINSPMAVIIDTLGNIINLVSLLENDYMSYVRVTYDDKLLFYTQTHESGEFDVYLFKLNLALEDDTIYTLPFSYDTLCPYQISSDTIGFDDCELIVGIEEDDKTVGLYDGRTIGLSIWPNPCREMLNVECLMLNAGDSYSLTVVDIFGRQVISLPPDGGRAGDGGSWQVDVSALPPGIYLAVVREGTSIVESGKFVVIR
jgi:hypothetical protein